jgi:hypothetical protein
LYPKAENIILIELQPILQGHKFLFFTNLCIEKIFLAYKSPSRPACPPLVEGMQRNKKAAHIFASGLMIFIAFYEDINWANFLKLPVFGTKGVRV